MSESQSLEWLPAPTHWCSHASHHPAVPGTPGTPAHTGSALRVVVKSVPILVVPVSNCKLLEERVLGL